MSKVKSAISDFGISRTVVLGLVIVLMISLFPLGINPGMTYSDCLTRVGMNGFLVIAMLFSIVSGSGLNFGLPIGILCGLISGSVALQFGWSGMGGFVLVCLISIPVAMVLGYFYAKLLYNVPGSEMTIGNYMAFSIVSLFSILWVILPYSNPKIVWPTSGVGLRTTQTLDDNFTRILDDFLKVDFRNIQMFAQSKNWRLFAIPTGLLLVFAVACLLVWLFMKTKAGVIMQCSGAYPRFARTLGINNNRVRTYGMMASMVFAAIGINIYSQSFGFYQFYSAPLMMAFPAMAAILIGGATPQKAKVSNVVIGVFIFQSLLTLATPVANAAIDMGSVSEVVRVIVQNGIILYALTKIRDNGGR